MLNFKPTISSAIVALGIEGGWKTKEGKIVKWWADEAQPSDSAIDTKLKELQAEYDAQEYARKRQAEYPSIESLVVGLYDTDDKADIEAKRAAVKAKFPKPE
jgi:hypothetical protein